MRALSEYPVAEAPDEYEALKQEHVRLRRIILDWALENIPAQKDTVLHGWEHGPRGKSSCKWQITRPITWGKSRHCSDRLVMRRLRASGRI